MHLDPERMMCTKDSIAIGEEYYAGCCEYEPYTASEEYQEEYYIAVKTEGGTVARGLQRGKRIEYNGRDFYTRDREEDDNCRLIDKRTGMGLSMGYLKDNWDKFIEKEKDIPDVMTYPLAEYIGRVWKVRFSDR
jgi:hypothetical protein